MDDNPKSIDDRLGRLKLATDAIHPSAGFQSRVMLAVASQGRVDLRANLWRVGRYGLVASFVLVALTTFFAVNRVSRTDELTAMTYGTVEQEW